MPQKRTAFLISTCLLVGLMLTACGETGVTPSNADINSGANATNAVATYISGQNASKQAASFQATATVAVATAQIQGTATARQAASFQATATSAVATAQIQGTATATSQAPKNAIPSKNRSIKDVAIYPGAKQVPVNTLNEFYIFISPYGFGQNPPPELLIFNSTQSVKDLRDFYVKALQDGGWATKDTINPDKATVDFTNEGTDFALGKGFTELGKVIISTVDYKDSTWKAIATLPGYVSFNQNFKEGDKAIIIAYINYIVPVTLPPLSPPPYNPPPSGTTKAA